jgi:voltage-gated sodium channel
MEHYGYLIDLIDLVILGVFIVEVVLKLYAFRLQFFKDPWNVFDFGIILISVLPAASSFSVFRAFRIVRTLRLIKNVPKLKFIIESLLKAIPSIGWIVALLALIFYVFAVIGTNLYGQEFPQWFGTLGKSMFTLFQIMTLESWASGIARPILDQAPFAELYFIIFILIATYTTLNVFIAIVVNTMNEMNRKEMLEEDKRIKSHMDEEQQLLLSKMEAMHSEISEIKLTLQEQQNRAYNEI